MKWCKQCSRHITFHSQALYPDVHPVIQLSPAAAKASEILSALQQSGAVQRKPRWRNSVWTETRCGTIIAKKLTCHTKITTSIVSILVRETRATVLCNIGSEHTVYCTRETEISRHTERCSCSRNNVVALTVVSLHLHKGLRQLHHGSSSAHTHTSCRVKYCQALTKMLFAPGIFVPICAKVYM